MNKIIVKAARDPRVTLVAGAFSGAIMGVFPVIAAILLGVITILTFIYAYKEHVGEIKQEKVTDIERRKLLQSDPKALTIARATNLNLIVVGNLIELVVHPNINSAIHVERSGWDPKEIKIHFNNDEFETTTIINEAGGIIEVNPPDGTKYCLVNTPFVTEESPTLVLELKKTKYSIIETTRKLLEQNSALSEKYSNVILEKNKLPTSLCLHFIIRLVNGKILCMKRSGRMAYYPNYWSMTGEEQFSDCDLANANPIDSLFKRALCEEIFHLRNLSDTVTALSIVENKIKFLRVYALGVEWPDINPALFGIAQLNINENEFKEYLVSQKAGLITTADEDREGAFSVINDAEALALLQTGECQGEEIFSGNSIKIRANKLHPTSRYRLYRLLRCIKRSSLIK